MLPTNFPEANLPIGKPEGWKDEDCMAIMVWHGYVKLPTGKPAHSFVTKWMPNKEDIENINKGSGIYIEFITTGLPPHSLHTTCPVPAEPVVLDPPNEWGLPNDLCNLIMQKIGDASMCWSIKPAGEFDIQRATDAGLSILNAISAHVKATTEK